MTKQCDPRNQPFFSLLFWGAVAGAVLTFVLCFFNLDKLEALDTWRLTQIARPSQNPEPDFPARNEDVPDVAKGLELAVYHGSSVMTGDTSGLSAGGDAFRNLSIHPKDGGIPYSYAYRLCSQSADQVMKRTTELLTATKKDGISSLAIIEHGYFAEAYLGGDVAPTRFWNFLRDHRSPEGGKIFLYECAVAGGPKGRAYCQNLARDTGYTIEAFPDEIFQAAPKRRLIFSPSGGEPIVVKTGWTMLPH